MYRKINLKSAVFALIFLCGTPLFALDLSLELCTEGEVEYKYTASGCTYTTQKRTCCGGGLWSAWDGDCSYTWGCRQVPNSYCAGFNDLLLSSPSGSIAGSKCSKFGEEGFSSGTSDGDAQLASGANAACYQCKCGGIPTSPECNCNGLSSGSCTAYINGAAYVGTRKCVANCLWDDCYSVSSPAGDYCGLTPGKTYPCTPAAYPENGGYQVCENSYTDPGQLQISSCRACGENQCLAKYGGSSINSSDGTYSCVSKPTAGSDTKGKYNCTAAKCTSMGMSSSPWTCTAKSYTSCYSGYVLSGTSCIDEGSGTIKPTDPGLLEPLL